MWVCLSSDWVDKEDCIFVEDRDFIRTLVHHMWWRTHQGAVILPSEAAIGTEEHRNIASKHITS